jgi:hypothetical protein
MRIGHDGRVSSAAPRGELSHSARSCVAEEMLAPISRTSQPSGATDVERAGVPSNKGMKLTKPERIGASQLIPGVRRT